MHFQRGQDAPRAVHYLRQAAENALQRYARIRRPSRHLTQGLELLATLPETPARAQQELDLQLALGPALIATKGYGAPEVEETYARARARCARRWETPQLFPTLARVMLVLSEPGALATARKSWGHSSTNWRSATATPSPPWRPMSALGYTLFYLGDYAAARTHLEQGIALTDPTAPRALGLRQDVAPEVRCLAAAANTLWCLGYPTQALRRSQEALTLAQALAHPPSLALAQHLWPTCITAAGRCRRSRPRPTPSWRWRPRRGFPSGWEWGRVGAAGRWPCRARRRLAWRSCHQGMAAVVATGQELTRPLCLLLLAEAAGHGGLVEEGLRLLAEALAALEASERGDLLAEAYRLQGALLLRQAGPDTAQAEACFQQALAIARRQQAKAWELRAAMSLSRLWQQQGKRSEAQALLAPLYGWFTEGFDTADLQEAQALLGGGGGTPPPRGAPPLGRG